MTEEEMVGWHHPLYGHEFELTPRVGDGQGGLLCYSSCTHPFMPSCSLTHRDTLLHVLAHPHMPLHTLALTPTPSHVLKRPQIFSHAHTHTLV